MAHKQLNTMGIKSPSEIQAKAIPVIKSGKKRRKRIKSKKSEEKENEIKASNSMASKLSEIHNPCYKIRYEKKNEKKKRI